MSTEQIHLEKITWDNYDTICKLRVTKEQDEFVARNDRSLIHAYAALSQGDIKPFPFGINIREKDMGVRHSGWRWTS